MPPGPRLVRSGGAAALAKFSLMAASSYESVGMYKARVRNIVRCAVTTGNSGRGLPSSILGGLWFEPMRAFKWDRISSFSALGSLSNSMPSASGSLKKSRYGYILGDYLA
nr:hypothetical protein Iba_chr11cCG9320 [Ipomoea batatas]